MWYELWHIPSGNAMSEHDSLAAALAALRELFEHEGEAAVTSVALLGVDARGRTKLVADREKLLSMTLEKAPQR